MRKALAGLLLSAVLILVLSLWSVSASPPQYGTRQERAEQSAACLNCHDGMDTTLVHSAHRLSPATGGMAGLTVSCLECHDGWQEHMNDPSKENISTGLQLGQTGQAAVCSRCHVDPHQSGMVSNDPHSRAGLACLTCHKIHSNPVPRLLKSDEPEFCTTCHTSVAQEFKRRSVHPLESQNIRCSDCHQAGYLKDNQLAVGLDWTCQQCHTELAGPYIYEHPVTYAHLVEGSGCTECHEPHGSVNDRLLRQPGSGNCLQCHGIPPLHRIKHSGLGARFDCAFCHSDVHGSNDNRLMLDPDLPAKFPVDCYNSSCHILGD